MNSPNEYESEIRLEYLLGKAKSHELSVEEESELRNLMEKDAPSLKGAPLNELVDTGLIRIGIKTLPTLIAPKYLGPFFQTIIQGIKIWDMLWVPDLTWQPGQEIPKLDPKGHPSLICVGVGLKNKCFKREEVPDIVSKLREAKGDVLLGDVRIPENALKEMADELDKRSKMGKWGDLKRGIDQHILIKFWSKGEDNKSLVIELSTETFQRDMERRSENRIFDVDDKKRFWLNEGTRVKLIDRGTSVETTISERTKCDDVSVDQDDITITRVKFADISKWIFE